MIKDDNIITVDLEPIIELGGNTTLKVKREKKLPSRSYWARFY